MKFEQYLIEAESEELKKELKYQNVKDDVQSLSDDNDYADKVYRGFGINKAVLKDLYSEEYSIEKTSGQVLVLKGDAQMTQETSTPPDNVRAINVPRVDVPNKNSGQTEQKSKKCHFPAIVFSARS